MPECEPNGRRTRRIEPRQIVAPEDGDPPRGMRQPGHRGEHLSRDVLTCNQQLDGFEPGREPRLDEVLPLDGEQPELMPLPRRRQLANQLQPRVGG
jgi:hypothetical protein